MKRVIAIGLILALCLPIIPAEKEVECKKFEVKFIITYNALTLQQAADMEKSIRKQFNDACKVNVKINETSSQITWYSAPVDSLCGVIRLHNN